MTVSSPPFTENVPIDSLRPNPLNPRGTMDAIGLQDLADSIRVQGILQPLLVTLGGVVVAGHRRLAAARLAGLSSVPVIARDSANCSRPPVVRAEQLTSRPTAPRVPCSIWSTAC